MKKVKQIAAIVGVVLLVGMYLISLIAAITASEHAHALFLASVFSTIVIPILIYAFLMIYKLVHKKDDGVSIRELKKMNKEYEKEEKQK